MKIQFLVDKFKKGYGNNKEDYWEEAETDGNETPEECANRIVDRFNNSLRPGEEVRTVVAVRMAQETEGEEKLEPIQYAYASWYCRLTLHCPYCEAYLDLNDPDEFPYLHDDEFPFSPGETMNEDDLKHHSNITCPICEKEFKLEGIGY